MKKDKKTILILWEFDALSEHALEYGVMIATKTENNLALLTTAHKKNLEDVKERLEEVADKCEQEDKIRPFCIVKTGKFKKVVKQSITELRCNLVFTKTDNSKNYNSKSLIGLIGWSNIPIVVVQDPPKRKEINHILSPVDFRTENKEKLSWIFYLAKYYNPKLHIFKLKINDPHLLKYVSNNLNFTKTQFKNKGIDYDIFTSEEKGSFADQTVRYAKDIDADLIVIMIKQTNALVTALFGVEEQRIIANEHRVPVMCLSPRTDIRKYGGFY